MKMYCTTSVEQLFLIKSYNHLKLHIGACEIIDLTTQPMQSCVQLFARDN